MSLPSEPPAAVPQPSRPHHDEGVHLRSKRVSMMSRPTRNNFLLATIILGTLSWLIVLVSQALVAATISNATVRIAWFGFIIQTFLLILVIEIFLCEMTIAYGLQISVFASLATVFAVIGVDQNIYLPTAATKAVGAGWLLVGIVNLIWIIYFTSPPESPFLRLPDAVNAPTVSRPPTMIHTVEKIGRSQDAFLMTPAGANANASATLANGPGPNVDPEVASASGKGDRVPGEAPLSSPSSSPALNNPPTSSSKKQNRPWNLYQRPNSGTRDTMLSAGARSDRTGVTGVTGVTGATNTRTGGAGGAGAQDHSMIMSDTTSGRPDSGAAAGPDTTQPVEANVPSWKAQALFDYKGSLDDPNELAFKKHDILTITDKSGKWWEATTADGRKGIAPSNYLKLIV